MDILLSIFVLGLIIGSFLNVVIFRVPRKLSVVYPARSYCPKCSATLSWFENIPVLSWLLLGGKCRHCKIPISGQYPLVELLSGAFAVLTFIRFDATPTALVVYLLCATLVAISFIDLEFRIIPNVISLPGMTFGLILGIASQYTGAFSWPITSGLIDSLVGFLIGGGVFYFIAWIYYLVTKKIGLGGGDIKLLGMTGAILGWESVPQTIVVGSIIGSVVGIAAMIVNKTGRNTEIPFGPWLSLGAVLYIFADIPFFRF